MHERLRHLAQGDLALRHQHRARDAGLRRVRGRARRRVAGGRADDGLRPLLHRLADRERHPPVLERTRGVGSLVLQPDVAAGLVRERVGPDERCAAFAQRDDRRRVGDRQAVAVLLDHARATGARASVVIPLRPPRAGRSTIARTTGRSRSCCSVFWNALSCVRCVMNTSVASSPDPPATPARSTRRCVRNGRRSRRARPARPPRGGSGRTGRACRPSGGSAVRSTHVQPIPRVPATRFRATCARSPTTATAVGSPPAPRP